jgi:hypothetical protein
MGHDAARDSSARTDFALQSEFQALTGLSQ